MAETPDTPLSQAHRLHDRHWRQYAYCYPVVSRRSGGLSIGVNLNPDQACNFDCVYCQVDRKTTAAVTKVDLVVLKLELERLLDLAIDRSLFAEPPLDCLAPDQQQVRDIAFSGDGEPTTFPRFEEAVRIAAEARQSRHLNDAKLILLTDACYLTKPRVRAALALLDRNNGEIWAKLDAGTQAYYEMVNRPNFPLRHVMENIIDAARVRPIVIQSLWMRINDQPPPEDELRAFANRLNEIVSAGGRIRGVQAYTVARQTTEPYVTALSSPELERIATLIGESTKLSIESYRAIG